VAGVFLVILLVALGYRVLTRNGATGSGVQAPAGMGGETGDAGLVDLTQIPLEEQGTRLFNRVMSSNSAGDTANVNLFLPMALTVLEQLAPTDPDGLYHFALLYQVGGEFESALAKAQEGLEASPDYLLLLAVAGEASASLGERAQAEGYYRHFLDVYDDELARGRPGYDHHQPIFPVYREEALAYLSQG